MKNTLKSLSVSLLLLLTLACRKTPVNPERPEDSSSLEFSETSITCVESDEKKTVTLVLSKASTRDLEVKVKVKGEQVPPIETTPAMVNKQLTLSIPKGSRQVSFDVKPIDNDVINETQQVILELTGFPVGLVPGEKKELTLIITDNESPTTVEFDEEQTHILENDGMRTILLVLSGKAVGPGVIEISYESDLANYGYHFTTLPAAENGKINLSIDGSSEEVRLKIIPVDNGEIEGSLPIDFRIISVTGSLAMGQQLTHRVIIEDDELAWFSKGYSTSAGGWRTQRFFGYHPNGKLSKVKWRQYTPGLQEGETVYHYNDNGRLTKATYSNGEESIYTYQNDQIVLEEIYKNSVVKEMVYYGYDQAGNVAEKLHLYRQSNGQMLEGLLFVYLYYTNGNIFKEMVYQPVVDGEPILLKAKTYDQYLEKPNPFPLEIIPNISAQPNLPERYTLEEAGKTLVYYFDYTFDNDDRLRKRNATGGNSTEETIYHYYD